MKGRKGGGVQDFLPEAMSDQDAGLSRRKPRLLRTACHSVFSFTSTTKIGSEYEPIVPLEGRETGDDVVAARTRRSRSFRVLPDLRL